MEREYMTKHKIFLGLFATAFGAMFLSTLVSGDLLAKAKEPPCTTKTKESPCVTKAKEPACVTKAKKFAEVAKFEELDQELESCCEKGEAYESCRMLFGLALQEGDLMEAQKWLRHACEQHLPSCLEKIILNGNDPQSGRYQVQYPNGSLKYEATYSGGPDNVRTRDWYENGNISSEISYVNGKRHGRSRYWFPNGQLAEEKYFKNDTAEGKWTKWDEGGEKVREESFRSGLNGGVTKEWKEGKLLFLKHYKEGKPHGITKTWDEEGNLDIVRQYKHGKFHGKQSFYRKGVVTSSRTYKNDVLDGIAGEFYDDGKKRSKVLYQNENVVKSEHWYPDGKREEIKNYHCEKDACPQHACAQHGVQKMWYENGQLFQEQHYRFGKKDGEELRYSPTGLLRERISFKDDKEDGVSELFYSNGQKASQRFLRNGKWNGEDLAWYSNGNIMSKHFYQDGLEHGQFENYFSDGKLALLSFYEGGKPTGLWVKYYSNGQKHMEGEYESGLRKGTWIEWREDGAQKATYHYEKGRLQGWRGKKIPKSLQGDERLDSKTDWISVVLLDVTGLPLHEAQYEITLPDGEVRKGQLDDTGLAILEGVAHGNAEVSFPEHDDFVRKDKEED